MKTKTSISIIPRAALMLLLLLTSATAWASELGYCDNCGFKTTHSVIGNTATCTRGGTIKYRCDICGLETAELVDALGHDWGGYSHVDATCTETGGQKRTCNRCGATETKDPEPALGHSYTSDGSHVCTRCGEDAGAVSYIDSDGTEQTRDDYSFITGRNDVTMGTSGATAWYALYGDVSLTSLKFNDKFANIILTDGAMLTIDASETGNEGIKAGTNGSSGTLNIYGQSGGNGTLNISARQDGISAYVTVNIYGGTVNVSSAFGSAIYTPGSSGITITGGTVSATATGSGYGISAPFGTVTVAGGNVTATGETYGISANSITITGGIVNVTGKNAGLYASTNDIILGWSSISDRITANSYIANGGSIIINRPFMDEDGVVHTADNVGTLAGKTLTPTDIIRDDEANDFTSITGTTNMMLVGRTIYRDDDWNTLCLPFSVNDLAGTPLSDLTLMEFDTETGKYAHDTGFSDGTLYLNFKQAYRVEAGKPYLIKKSGPPAYAPTGGTANILEGYSYDKLMDGNKTTGWRARLEDGMAYCDIQADEPFHATTYALTTSGYVYLGNNTNPTAWTLKGKLNEGDEWAVIDSRNSNVNSDDALLSDMYTPKEFTIQQPGDYQYYRLEVTGVAGGNVIELIEMTMDGRCVVPLTNPYFSGVTVSSTTPTAVTSDDGKVSFVGSYSPVDIAGEDHSILFLGASNTLYYPNDAMTINSCRAHFELNGITAGDPSAGVRAFVFNFGGEDEATGITTTNYTNGTNPGGAWFSLDGRRLSGKPTQRGMYIVNGKKVVIK